MIKIKGLRIRRSADGDVTLSADEWQGSEGELAQLTRELEVETDKFGKDSTGPKFTDMERSLLYQIYVNGINSGKSVQDIGREVEEQ